MQPSGLTKEFDRPVGGLQFRAVSAESAVDDVLHLALGRVATHVHLVNAYTVSLASRDRDYFHLLHEGILYADGKPISWSSTLSRQEPRIRQIRGPQLFLDTLDRGRQFGIRHFFLGGTDETLRALGGSISKRFPGIEVAGSYSPPFRPMTEADRAIQDQLIRESNADIVWIGLGTPKQDLEARRVVSSTCLPTVAVGAAFAFTAGTLPIAPMWMQKAGLEWLFRFASEPKRLWRRYTFGNLLFLRAVWLNRQRRI